MTENTSISVDPVSAIASAIGDIFSGVSGIFTSKMEKDIRYQEYLNLGVPDLIDHFDFKQPDRENTWILPAILALVFVVIVIAIVLTKRK